MRIGFYQSYWGAIGGGQRYTGLAAQMLSEIADVEFLHHHVDFDRRRIENSLDLDLSRITFRCLPEPQRPSHMPRSPLARLSFERDWCRELSEKYDLFINNSDHIPVYSHARCGVLLTHFPLVTYQQFNGRTNGDWSRRPVVSRWARQVFQRIDWQRRFSSYEKFVVNSEYGRDWIKRRWGVSADVLYPPLRSGLSAGEKESIILTVGAYHDSQHKKQDVLLDSFKAMVDAGLRGWRYVLVGGLKDSQSARDFVERLRHAAIGYPVEIRTNVSGEDLQGLFRVASILWHAMGLGVDALNQPDKLEHFGMVATEAMAAGCVPVVFNGGGLREIVRNGIDGLLWDSVQELKSASLRLISNDAQRRAVALAAVERSNSFSTNAFRQRIFQLLGPHLNAN